VSNAHLQCTVVHGYNISGLVSVLLLLDVDEAFAVFVFVDSVPAWLPTALICLPAAETCENIQAFIGPYFLPYGTQLVLF